MHEITVTAALVGLLAAGFLTLIGNLLRNTLSWLKKYDIPGALIGGVIGIIFFAIPLDGFENASALREELRYIWHELPTPLITLVFAGLVIGKTIPTLADVFRKSGPQLAIGYTLAWGHYVVGIALTMLILVPFFGTDPLAGALIAIGFQGGYGAAAGLIDTYEKLGFESGETLAIGMATAGKIGAIMLGIMLVNRAKRSGQLDETPDKPDPDAAVPEETAERLYRQVRYEEHRPDDALILQLGILASVIALAWLTHQALLVAEATILGDGHPMAVISYIPLFPIALITSFLVQYGFQKMQRSHLVNRRIMDRLTGAALEILIVAALATLHVGALLENGLPLLILTIAGILFNIAVFFYIAPKLYHRDPWVYGAGDLAHSTGAATTGLLIMQTADPKNEIGVKEAFGYKQSFYEPMVGGGLITALSLPIMHVIGPWNWFIAMSVLFIGTVIASSLLIRVHRKAISD